MTRNTSPPTPLLDPAFLNPGTSPDSSDLPHVEERYDVTERIVPVGSATFHMLTVKDTNRLLDEMSPEEFARDERFPYWAEIWSSSVGLAAYCLEELPLRDRTVLELGCGLGLAGIAAAHAGASVTLTDHEADALAFAARNCARNLPTPEHSSRLALAYLDWREEFRGETFERILGSDIVYERRSFHPLLTLLRNALAPGGMAILADPGRSMTEVFLSLAEHEGWSVRTKNTPVFWNGRSGSIALHELTMVRS